MTAYTGRGNPFKSLGLLWGARRAGRGPAPGIGIDRIVKAAVKLADQEGLGTLSMRRVAAAVGHTTMALYRYVPGKAELLDVMLDAAYGELKFIERPSQGWRDGLRQGARELWALFQRHPWLQQVATSRPVPAGNAMAAYEAMLQAAAGTGLSAREQMAVVHLVYAFVHGAGRFYADAMAAERDTGVSEEKWWAERAQVWQTVFATGRFPKVMRLAETRAFAAPDGKARYRGPFGFGEFDFCLERLLDGVEARARDETRRDESAAVRDETPGPAAGRDEHRDETSGGCRVCGRPVGRAATGRPRDYCSRACQQRAYRSREGG